MSYLDTNNQTPHPDQTDPFADPVTYLAVLGIEAELVEVIPPLPEAA